MMLLGHLVPQTVVLWTKLLVQCHLFDSVMNTILRVF